MNPTRRHVTLLLASLPLTALAQPRGGEDYKVLDVRQPGEWEIVNLKEFGAELIPLDLLLRYMDRLDPHEKTVVYCRTGARSGQAVQQMGEAGFEQVFNLEGGVLAWHDEVDAGKPQY